MASPGCDRHRAFEQDAVEPMVEIVPDAAHWIAEENPQGLVDAVVRFDTPR